MLIRPRVIPCLLLNGKRLVKTIKFRDPTYLGDPINIIKIFNDKEVDELILLDITASIEDRRPNFYLIEKITSECFMPICYGGGIHSTDDIERIISLGIEKIAINTYAAENPEFIQRASDLIGSQSIVISIDVKLNWNGKYNVFIYGGRKKTNWDVVDFAHKIEIMGAGEILINSINRDGTMKGYDTNLIKNVTHAVSIPVIACGGAGNLNDLKSSVSKGGASAVAAGSLFVYQGRNRSVLINYPTEEEINKLFNMV
ncbi:MAG TPA: imidazole glycerol phosphate synthase subunit HisF [Anaerolineae bacterium]|nr:imidazole glycerol phosphate synthase subunit HisF [Anaerolineae bacterium]